MLNFKKVTGRQYWMGLGGLVLVLLAILPLLEKGYTVILLTSIIMYVVMTVAWTLFSGTTGYLSLASAAFFGVGIYASAILGKDLPFAVVIIIGGAVCFVLAVIVGAITLRLRGVYFAIFTLGLVELMKNVILWYEVKFTGTRGRFVVVVDNNTIYWAMLIVFVALLAVMFLIRRSRWGLALQSIGEYEEAASHMGINTTLMKTVIFGVSAFFIGTAGAIIATRWTYIDPYIAFNYFLSFLPVLMAIFGGMANWYGPIVGAAIFAYLEELLLTRFPYHYMIIFGVMLLVAIMYLPEGITGLIRNSWRRFTGGKRAPA
jgi:branched-chain amino acid transport system permease protein